MKPRDPQLDEILVYLKKILIELQDIHYALIWREAFSPESFETQHPHTLPDEDPPT